MDFFCQKCGAKRLIEGPFCPQCGARYAAGTIPGAPLLVELTSKELKARYRNAGWIMLIGVLILGPGLVAALAGLSGARSAIALGTIVLLVGALGQSRAKYLMWWHHG
jgi:hypothetical protein